MKRRRHPYRMRRRRVPADTATRTAEMPNGAARRMRSRSAAQPLSVNVLRTAVCGALFVTLVALKLLLPGRMNSVRGRLDAWLTRDADFVSAFSAVGHAVSGEGGMLDQLEDAYVAVFGASEAAEVSGAAAVEQETPAQEKQVQETAEDGAPPPSAEDMPYPEHAAAAQRILGFDYAAPLKGTVTSPFGWRTHPADGREAFHYGVDIAADEGAEIRCFADGTVGVVAQSVELGNYLTVHHANGILTLYAHCSRITVHSGDAVRLGDKLAETGSTGNATGPHLHFEVHDGEDCLDPAYYLS